MNAPPTAGSPREATPREIGRRAWLLAAGGAVGSLWWRSAEASHVVKPWPAARPVPELDLTDIDGKPWKLDAVAGHVVVLNFWATWCEPCRTEMPSLAVLGERQKKAGLVVVAVNYREPAPLVRRFLEQQPLRATVLLDADGDAATDWTPRVFPSTVLIGRDGKPQSTVVGGFDWTGQEAQQLLAPLLAAPRPRR